MITPTKYRQPVWMANDRLLCEGRSGEPDAGEMYCQLSPAATIPIVMAASGEPLDVGIVASLARLDGNVTGLSAFAAELMGKRLEILKEMVPAIERISALLNMSNPAIAIEWKSIETAACSKVDVIVTRGHDEILSLRHSLTHAGLVGYRSADGDDGQFSELAVRAAE